MIRLDKDILQKALCGEDRETPIYYKYYRGQSYDALWALAIDNVTDGKSALIHSSNTGFYRNDYEEFVRKKLHGLNVLLKVIYCIAPEAEIRRRLTQRSCARDYSKLTNDNAWRQFVAKEVQFRAPPIHHLKIDTTKDEEYNIRKAKDYIIDPQGSMAID